MYTVIIQSINNYDEVEWEETVTSKISLRGAKNKATRWLNKENFDDLIVEKGSLFNELDRMVIWRLV